MRAHADAFARRKRTRLEVARAATHPPPHQLEQPKPKLLPCRAATAATQASPQSWQLSRPRDTVDMPPTPPLPPPPFPPPSAASAPDSASVLWAGGAGPASGACGGGGAALHHASLLQVGARHHARGRGHHPATARRCFVSFNWVSRVCKGCLEGLSASRGRGAAAGTSAARVLRGQARVPAPHASTPRPRSRGASAAMRAPAHCRQAGGAGRPGAVHTSWHVMRLLQLSQHDEEAAATRLLLARAPAPPPPFSMRHLSEITSP